MLTLTVPFVGGCSTGLKRNADHHQVCAIASSSSALPIGGLCRVRGRSLR